MGRRLKHILEWSLWAIIMLGAPSVASARADGCALPRAVIAGEIALRDALSRSDGNAAPLLAALARLALQANDTSEISAYIASRRELAAALGTGNSIVARQLIRTPAHQVAGQQALIAVRNDSGCGVGQSANAATAVTTPGDGGQIAGGHGGISTSSAASATGDGRAAQPSGNGLATSPLSFLRGFDATLHVIPTIGATLAFSALIFALTRNRRQYRRYLCHLPVEIKGPNGQIKSTLLDISRGGAKLARTEEWDRGTRLKINLINDTVWTSARIVWMNDGFAGVLFRKPLTAPEFQTLLDLAIAGAGIGHREPS